MTDAIESTRAGDGNLGRMPAWQPRETAPKDGTSFLSLNRSQGDVMAVTWWHPALGRFNATGGQSFYQFTHWQPLPAAPDFASPVTGDAR